MKTDTPEEHIIGGEICIKEVRLEIERCQLQYGMDLNYLRESDFSIAIEHASRKMILTLQAKVASKKFAVKTVRYPSDWWQSFKKRFFSMRMLKRWPVKYDEVTLEASAYHPEISIPDRKAFVNIMVATRRGLY